MAPPARPQRPTDRLINAKWTRPFSQKKRTKNERNPTTTTTKKQFSSLPWVALLKPTAKPRLFFLGLFFCCCRSSFVVSRTCFYCFLTFWFRGIPPPLPQSIRPSKKAPRAFLKVALKPKKELFFFCWIRPPPKKKWKKNEVKPGNKSWIEFLILRETTSSPRSRPSRTEM